MPSSPVALTVALIATVPLIAPGPASAASLPDLSVSSGTARVKGSTVTAGVKVRNRGRTARTTVVLRADRGRRRHTLRRVRLKARRRSGRRTVRLRARTTKLKAGRYRLRVCVDPDRRVRERREGNNCRTVGTLRIRSRGGATVTPPTPDPDPTTPTPPVPDPDPPAPDPDPPVAGDPPVPPPCATPACAPAAIPARQVPFTVDDALGRYWAFVPTDYDAATPTRLLVWLHGCGGNSEGELWNVGDYYPDLRYIAIAPDGSDGGCWSMTTHPRRVTTAIADAIARFNVDPRRVVIGGYSSGGDLSYRTAFHNAKTFAGLLAINTSPFRDTASTAAASLAAATWRFPVHHIAHVGDATYPIGPVRTEIQAVTAAGHPVTFDERPGGHWQDVTGDPMNPGTSETIRDLLVRPGMARDWTSPAP
ncbi:MAG: hypothetical protein M0P31_05215 [Solirubrobacteraceae bacterium]|nr:hypothetical protein [Solirubrobacteraceae bacterium]